MRWNETAPPTPRKTVTIRIRNCWRSANWTRRWIMIRFAGLVLQGVRELQEQAAVADHFVAGGKPLQDLRLPVLVLPNVDRAPAELVCAAGDVNKGLILVVAQHCRIR